MGGPSGTLAQRAKAGVQNYWSRYEPRKTRSGHGKKERR
ncbi:hypothetical protein SBRY_30837 [Actinacidiphila bryophytorum]|uniref:Uncharacterized protein n=1 Tax=Actinacidiphila bryophytorum TaxID=1436133 RepID=A0A9W4H1X2_9ACTN|nr:hypothetical protein SBRY_30837 [Actinacidiphila bryophytorum]